jgi:hypothetical protein
MPEIHASVSAVIDAPPRTIYGIIADYHRGHPAILPRKYFENLVVEEGGVGAGTRIRFDMRSFGGVRTFRAAITEPEPGRRLVETDVETGTVTTFTVERGPKGPRHACVTIETRYRRGGVRGWVERVLAPLFLRTVYRAEVVALAEQARTAAAGQRLS